MGHPDFRVGGRIFATLAACVTGLRKCPADTRTTSGVCGGIAGGVHSRRWRMGEEWCDPHSIGNGKQGRTGRSVANRLPVEARKEPQIRQQEAEVSPMSLAA